jgi:hypothetical protein
MDIRITGRFDYLENINEAVSKDIHTIILSDRLLEAYAPAFKNKSFAAGDLDTYLEKAMEKQVYVSKPTQLIVLYHDNDISGMEQRLKSIFGSDINRIKPTDEHPAFWEIILYPNK